MLRENIAKIFKNYLNSRDEQFANHPIAAVLRRDLPKDLESLTENSNDYKFAGSAGQGNWTHSPWIAAFHKKITESAQSGYYIVYLFREDMEGVYLSLNQGMTDIKNQTSNSETKEILKSRASDFRNQLKNYLQSELLETIDLGVENSPNATFYEAGNIYAKYYSSDNLPSENVLESDYIEILGLYDQLVNKNVNFETIEKQNEILDSSNNSTSSDYLETKQLIIKELFKDFNDEFLSTETGKNHLPYYETDCQRVRKNFETIRNNPEIVNDTSDPIINYLLPIKGKPIAPAAVGSITAFGYTAEDLPKLTLTVFKLVDDLRVSNDKTQQKQLINDFKKGPYSKGFQTAMMSPVLYCMNKQYWLYNTKTVKTYKFISEILENNDQINGLLDDYIDNLDKLHKLVDNISSFVPEFTSFKVFDAFCHWLCDPKLGYYAVDKEKYDAWLLKHDFNGNKKFNSFYEFFTNQGFKFKPEIIENFLLSLKVKPFAILTGNSGTGKTKIAQLFAEYLKTKTFSQHKIVPVGANWTENRHLLGFYNIITKNYQKTPALNLIRDASKNTKSPYFLILDEMNLSHVERYFADFLSAMESEEPIPLHSNEDDEIPWELDIPRNLLVIGTVNVDETTYMFSPKVLDRANTIEFSTYPAKDYMHSVDHNEIPQGNLEYLENPLSGIETRKFTIKKLNEKLSDVKINSNDNLWDVLADEIQAFQEVLGKAGFDFGFRVINEILRFMYVAWVYEGKPEVWSNWMRYFDAQIKQKMLPKLHGSQRVLEEVLKDLFDLCYIDTIDSPPRSFEDLKSVPTVKYLESAQKIQEMDKVLNEQRYVSFIN
jgi:hypothetical protein